MSELGHYPFFRQGSALLPGNVVADEFLMSLKPAEYVLVSLSKVRSIEQHNYFWALLRVVVRATDRWVDEDNLLYSLKFAIGYTFPVRGFDDIVYPVPGSISFGAMSADRFRRFFDKALAAISVITGIDAIALLEQTDREAPRPKSLEGYKWQEI